MAATERRLQPSSAAELSYRHRSGERSTGADLKNKRDLSPRVPRTDTATDQWVGWLVGRSIDMRDGESNLEKVRSLISIPLFSPIISDPLPAGTALSAEHFENGN